MRMSKLFLIGMLCTLLLTCQKKVGMIETIMRNSGEFEDVLAAADKHKLQIIYTQIDRDQQNKASFRTFRYRVDNQEYFYPASSIKLPMVALAMEKINDVQIDNLSIHSDMLTDSSYTGQTTMHHDSTSENGKPSIAHFIKKILLVSDNDAFNRLYEFVGQQEANERLIMKGYKDIRITHRLSLPLSIEQNKHTNPMRFYNGDELVYEQEPACSAMEIKSKKSEFIGKGYMKNDQLVSEPMDFTHKNAISLESLQKVLLSLIFPENFTSAERFNLTNGDYRLLYEYMSKYPGESDFPDYGSEHSDGYCKFLMFGGSEPHIDRNIRIYNKVGEAYGFLIDMAYIVDFDKKIEFVLGAVIYVNENEILNDGNYEYENIGYPFMRVLGKVFYDYEVKRDQKYKPDLSKYNWKLWAE